MSSTHIIRRQVLEVSVLGTEADGFALQRKLPELCEDELTPALERLLERSAPADEHWSIDRLEVDAGSFGLDNLERDLVEAVTRALEKLLRERAAPGAPSLAGGAVQRRTPAQSVREAFLYFLHSGSLPWWFHLPAGQTLEEVARASWQGAGQTEEPPPNFVRDLIEATGSAVVRERLARQFSAEFLQTLLASLSHETAAAVAEVFAMLGEIDFAGGTPRRFAGALWQAAFAAAAAGVRPTPFDLVAEGSASLPIGERQDLPLRERIAQLWPEALSRQREEQASPGSASKNKAPVDEAGARAERTERKAPSARVSGPAKSVRSAEPGVRIDLEEGVFIHCAGVVLLHPFLPRFFEGLGIAAKDKLLQPERAMCLLHFLATGQRVAPEYELLLPKLLCNVPFEAPVDSRIELSAAEEEEAVALLQAVVRHWGALGDTSIDGLRGTYLVRPGKLSRRESDDLLQVEHRSFDVLLDRLPWGIGMVHLPWMNRLLSVEWR